MGLNRKKYSIKNPSVVKMDASRRTSAKKGSGLSRRWMRYMTKASATRKEKAVIISNRKGV
jgi:hypothetical protein